MAFSRWGRTKVLLRAANVDTDRSANDRFIIKSIRLALEAASLQWMEGEKELPMRTPRSSSTNIALSNCSSQYANKYLHQILNTKCQNAVSVRLQSQPFLHPHSFGIKDYLLTVLLELCITLGSIEECLNWCNPKLVGIMIKRYS